MMDIALLECSQIQQKKWTIHAVHFRSMSNLKNGIGWLQSPRLLVSESHVSQQWASFPL